jgi:hypothetical protein
VIGNLYWKLGQLQVRARFSCGSARHLPTAERRAMITPEAELSVSRQRAARDARSSFYYLPRPRPRGTGPLKRVDRIFRDHVYGGRLRSRLQVALLRRPIRRLMRKLGLWAVTPKRNISKRHPTFGATGRLPVCPTSGSGCSSGQSGPRRQTTPRRTARRLAPLPKNLAEKIAILKKRPAATSAYPFASWGGSAFRPGLARRSRRSNLSPIGY